jgi:hypothetical protein
LSEGCGAALPTRTQRPLPARRGVWVALASLDGAPPHLRGRWLTVRAKADDLYVGVDDLICANQAYRWNSAPWMWGTAAGTNALAERALAARQRRAGADLAAGTRGPHSLTQVNLEAAHVLCRCRAGGAAEEGCEALNVVDILGLGLLTEPAACAGATG